MKLPKSKTVATLIASFLVLTIAATLVALPIANAHTPAWQIPTYAFMAVAPNPIGVDQSAMVVLWLNVYPPTATGKTGDRWQNITVAVTKPDGSKETLGPITSDPVGSNYFHYVPNQIGTYYFQMSFPGQTLTGGTDLRPEYQQFVGDYYGPSTSSQVALTVQQEQIQPWPEVPLPTGYWSRPIEAENREWWPISGNWLQSTYDAYGANLRGAFNPYTTAPNTGHIAWTKEVMVGGLIGGEYGSIGYMSRLSWGWGGITPGVIINGKLYYNTWFKSRTSFPGFVCVDLRTGEELWRQENATITLGQIMNVQLPNDIGGAAYLWKTGTAYEMRDAFSGNLIMTLENALTGPVIFGPSGEMLVYILDGTKNRLVMWNSSMIPQLYSDPAQAAAATGSLAALTWGPNIGTFDWRTGIQLNVSVPDVPGTQSLSLISPDVIYARTTFTTATTGLVTAQDVAYSIKPTDFGRVLFGPINRTAEPSRSALYMRDGVLVDYVKEKMQLYAYDIYSGNEIWVSKPFTEAWDMYRSGTVIAYDKFYFTGFGGRVYCYDLKNGSLLWNYYTGSSGFATPYGEWPFAGALTVADGKIYAGNGEHSPTQPNLEGERLHVVNATTGEGVWSILGWYGGPAIADGYMVAQNGYDGRIYCFGKGPSATTVTASPKVSVHGDSVLIEGAVTDQSAGATGTPAIADESMTEWMEYMYMQKPIPTNATGVEVTLDTIDPNGNYVHIGTVTSDTSGMFKKAFVPEVPGEYTIIATFERSESYWSSHAETAMYVGEAPATAPPEYPQPIDPTLTIVVMSIVLMIAMIITVVFVGIWIRRK
jgi:hypothetical protein